MLNLFISYSHNDDSFLSEFVKHLAPLFGNKTIDIWYDKKILGGNNLFKDINDALTHSNIICCLISADYLASVSCIDELNKAFTLRITQGVRVCPIIIKACGWKDNEKIKNVLVFPTDGKPVAIFDNAEIWQDVYINLQKVIDIELQVQNIAIKNDFNTFLEDCELLKNAHGMKSTVTISDIFIYLELNKYDDLGDFEKRISSSILLEELSLNKNLIISGETQSGKTTLCKVLFKELKKINLIPVYLYDKSQNYEGIILNRLKKAFTEQYNSKIDFDNIPKEKIIPIIDDFHYANKKEKILAEIRNFLCSIIIVDDVFSLNISDEGLTKDFFQYKIKRLSPSLRAELIKKWLLIKGQGVLNIDNEFYKNFDNTNELVETTLGKILNSGIMPEYPFFILSILSTTDLFEKPLDKEITSQGYCYQSLIYLYLRKNGVKNDEIDIYINFLTEIAFYFFDNEKEEIAELDLTIFINEYQNVYNLPLKTDVILKTLSASNIFRKSSCNNYYFPYSYLFFYFVAKYLSENIDKRKNEIDGIMNSLHLEQNSYIAIFIAHHTKNDYILDKLQENAQLLFDKHQSTTLSSNEMVFFNEGVNKIINLTMPDSKSSPEVVRRKQLEIKDEIEEKNSKNNYSKKRKRILNKITHSQLI